MAAVGQTAYFDNPSKRTQTFVPLKRTRGNRAPEDKVSLLWGDEVFVFALDGTTATVSSRGHDIEIPVAHLRDDPILSWYQIDCGQGDASLLHLPDGRWVMIDAGPAKSKSNSHAGVVDFIAWKTFVDQSWKFVADIPDSDKPFRMTVVATHPDSDHYAGFRDMNDFIDSGIVKFDQVFHCGVGRFDGTKTAVTSGSGHSQLGPVVGTTAPDLFLDQLIDGFDDVRKFHKDTGTQPFALTGEFGSWLSELEAREGNGVGPLARVDASMDHLPTFEPANSQASLRLLGPVLEPFRGQDAKLRYLDSASASGMKQPSLTRNGQSVVIRVDYKKARLMLTGDLNFRSQVVLMNTHPDEEFKCDVAKACHHGSDDISHTFLAKMAPLATLFSSGDNETHVHPRAKALALAAAATPLRETSGSTKFLGFSEPKVDAPLIYSTELSRSVQLFRGGTIVDKAGGKIIGAKMRNKPRSASGKVHERSPKDWLLADDMVYGLINVRTDGESIVIAVMNEGSSSFHVQELDID